VGGADALDATLGGRNDVVEDVDGQVGQLGGRSALPA